MKFFVRKVFINFFQLFYKYPEEDGENDPSYNNVLIDTSLVGENFFSAFLQYHRVLWAVRLQIFIKLTSRPPYLRSLEFFLSLLPYPKIPHFENWSFCVSSFQKDTGNSRYLGFQKLRRNSKGSNRRRFGVPEFNSNITKQYYFFKFWRLLNSFLTSVSAKKENCGIWGWVERER